ncbi:myelin-associated glycoprotein [Pholidichthys leucotaenia]
MGVLWWSLFFMQVCFKAFQAEASSWTIDVPSTVNGLLGSCVVIPCSYNHPSRGFTKLRGIWYHETDKIIYHQETSRINQQYRGRTNLLGDLGQNNCSLKIDRLNPSDTGPFYFRIEIEQHDSYSYKEKKISISIADQPPTVGFSVKEEIKTGENVSASCSVIYSCPASPPVFTWSHSGVNHIQAQPLEHGQWKVTSTLIFQPTHMDQNKTLRCNIAITGIKPQEASQILKVKHPPVNVIVDYKSDVHEGETVRLYCTSDAYPPVTSYQWHDEKGAQLSRANMLVQNITRHTAGPMYCSAINEEGQGRSNPVKFNVLYAPDIKTGSSCTSDGDVVKCVCITESNPPSLVQFVLADRVLHSTNKETHGFLTFSTLQTDFGSSKNVICLANNTLGKANLTLPLPVNSDMQNILIASIGGMILLILVIVVGAGIAKKCRGRPNDVETSNLSTMEAADKAVALPQYATTKRKKTDDYSHWPHMNESDHVYGNVLENDEAIYANM